MDFPVKNSDSEKQCKANKTKSKKAVTNLKPLAVSMQAFPLLPSTLPSL